VTCRSDQYLCDQCLAVTAFWPPVRWRFASSGVWPARPDRL